MRSALSTIAFWLLVETMIVTRDYSRGPLWAPPCIVREA